MNYWFRLFWLAVLFIFSSQLYGQPPERLQLLLMGGVFSPSNDEMKDTYGDAGTVTLFLAAPVTSRSRLKFGINYVHKSGDPFHQSDDFNSDDAATLTFGGLSLSWEGNPLTVDSPKIYFGAGVNYVFAKESIRGQESSTGSAIGAHVSVFPEFRLSNRLSFLTEVRYSFLEIPFKNSRDQFNFNLSGAGLLIGLGYRL